MRMILMLVDRIIRLYNMRYLIINFAD
jgi:hypothetical protein